MRFLVSILFIFVFFAELTLDSSTMFVRASAGVVTASHAALPVSAGAAQVWDEDHADSQAEFADIIIPSLNPPVSKIKRPPIC